MKKPPVFLAFVLLRKMRQLLGHHQTRFDCNLQSFGLCIWLLFLPLYLTFPQGKTLAAQVHPASDRYRYFLCPKKLCFCVCCLHALFFFSPSLLERGGSGDPTFNFFPISMFFFGTTIFFCFFMGPLTWRLSQWVSRRSRLYFFDDDVFFGR